jgi:hypothetical protein
MSLDQSDPCPDKPNRILDLAEIENPLDHGSEMLFAKQSFLPFTTSRLRLA